MHQIIPIMTSSLKQVYNILSIMAVCSCIASPSHSKWEGLATQDDDNRVILEPIEDHEHTYINASYIKGYSSEYSYIATQGPTDLTVVDFWRLIWQEQSSVIVMVTNLIEDTRSKCNQYWPSEGTQDYGPFEVTLVDEQTFIDYTVRKLHITQQQTKSSSLNESTVTPREVTQYHFTSWPDHGVPQYSNSMMSFHRHVMKKYNPSDGPITVHCSAGVGRTGTFITIDITLQQIEKEGVVNIPGVINGLRHQRVRMVQTLDQYVFIHDAILEYLIFGSTQINVADLRIHVNQMDKVDTKTGKNEFRKQFEVISKVTPKPDAVPTNTAQDHPMRNRSMNYLPPDRHRIYLMDESNNYIHASFINGFKKARSFIVAENPMKNTCVDFWRMIRERKVNVVVMLGNTMENRMDMCHIYWPVDNGHFLEYGDMKVTLESQETKEEFTKRVMKLSHKTVTQTITQYQITSWLPDGEISEVGTITEVLGEVWKIQQRSGGSAPIIVHCSDTVTRSGIFSACATAIEKCKAERVVEIFQVVKAQRLQKPGSVPNYKNYRLIFDIVLAYLDSFELYSNFERIN